MRLRCKGGEKATEVTELRKKWEEDGSKGLAVPAPAPALQCWADPFWEWRVAVHFSLMTALQ